MKVIITQWALNAYLNLKAKQAFSHEEYWNTIRPDVLLLKQYPNALKFKNGKFWSIAKDGGGSLISQGYKMKWHQVGSGKIQLRLPIAMLQQAVLCAAYVKENEKQEKRKLAIFKTHLQLIQQNRYIECGVFT
jgi:hypothetical protein